MTATGSQRRRRLWPAIVRREVEVRLRDRIFLLTTAAMVLLLLGSLGVAAYMNSSGKSTQKVGVTDERAAQIVRSMGAQGTTAEPRMFGSTTEAEDAVRNGDPGVALVTTGDQWRVVVNGDPESRLATQVQAAASSARVASNAADSGVSMEKLTAGAQVPVDDVGQKGTVSRSVQKSLSLAFALVFYMAIVLFGTSIAQSVVAEKESRIIEILASMVPLRQILIGKILGMSSLAFLQIAVFAGVAVAGLKVMHLGADVSGVTTALLWFVPFFALGFLALACVWAVAGSLAARNEDLQATSMPLTLGLALVLFAPMVLEGQWLRWASYVPLFSSVLMPVRALAGDLSWWEPVVALALVAAFCAVVLRIGETLYRRSVMHTSGTQSWKSLLLTRA